MSILTSRSRIGAMLGQMFGGKRDLYKVYGYSKNINFSTAYGKYARQDIVGRIIDAPADALWTKPPTVTGPTDEWNKAWNDLVVRLSLWNQIGRVDRLAGLGEYATLLIGINDGRKVSEKAAGGKHAVTYLQPYSCDAATVTKLVEDTSDPAFMKPKTYSVNPSKDNSAGKAVGSAFNADASRVLHIVENPLTDDVYGNSRIERIYNLTDDLLKIVGGTAETFWLTSNKGLQIDVDKDMELTPDDEKALSDEIDEYQNQLRRVLRTRGIKVTPLGSDVPDPKTAFEMLLSLMSGATGIPKRILLGSEAGQLASDQDRNNWAERIIERRTNFGEPLVLKPLIRKLTALGVLPPADESKIAIVWPEAFVLSPLERAQAGAQRARSAANMAKALDSGTKLFTVDEGRAILDLLPTTAREKTEGPSAPKQEEELVEERDATEGV